MVILCVMKQNVYLNSLLFTHTLAGGSLRRHHGDEFCKQKTNGSASGHEVHTRANTTDSNRDALEGEPLVLDK